MTSTKKRTITKVKPPPEILVGLSPEEVKETKRWWNTLSVDARGEFMRMWDHRSEDTALYGTTGADGDVTWHELPIELRGALIDDENDRDMREAKRHMREYIANHAADFAFFLMERQFHICRSHPAARAVIENGVLPASFTCPVDDAACPMRTILGACPAGKSVAIEAVVRLRGLPRA